jgi:hypothetical protein
MHPVSPSKRRHDVWQWFVDEESQTGVKMIKHGKVKAYCDSCLREHMASLRETDEQSGKQRSDEDRYKECE